MRPYSLLAWALCSVVLGSVTLLCSPAAAATTAAPSSTSTPHIVKQINRVNDDGSYTIGYEAADGTFKIETKDPYGNVKGMFGFLDTSGHIKRVAYSTTNSTDSPQSIEDLNTVTEPTAQQQHRRPAYLARNNVRRSPLKYRRTPLVDLENPADDQDAPVFAMLLRRSRQGLPTRSDADELLRIQQQSDASDVYGNGVSSGGYQVPEVPFRQHFLQSGRGRVQNSVLQHHLRQLTPDQLYELQQYASNSAAQTVPEPTYAPRGVPTTPYPSPLPARPLMNPLLQYLAGNSVAREVYDQTYPTRYPYTPVPVPGPGPSPYFYPPAGYSGVTSARSYPFQNPNLPEELRQALFYRMLLTARLLGLEGFIARYANGQGEPVYDQYAYDDPRAVYGQRPASAYYDPRVRGQLPLSYNPAYYQTLALARANHARQLAAYQQSLAQEPRQYATRPSYTAQDYTDDPAVIELRRQFGDPSVTPASRYVPHHHQQLVYRTTAAGGQQDDDQVQYVTVTPTAAPSVSSTTPGSTASQRTPSERPTPSYIQRVRSVQVLNPATASPRASATTASPTTRRPQLAA